MKRYRYKENVLYEFDSGTKAEFVKQDSIVTIGVYDGVHFGHRHILTELVNRAREHKRSSVVITFEPHPRKVVSHRSGEEIKVLTTLEEKIPMLESLGVDVVIVVEFTKAFSEIAPEVFVENFLIKEVGLSEIFIGYDHGFGKDRKGTIETLQVLSEANQFEVVVIEEQRTNEQHVSSTSIRNFLQEGRIEEANQLLGNPYRLTGKVISGDQLGRTIGFPTANLEIDPDKLIPKSGVYVADVFIGKSKFRAMLNIGFRPTVSEMKQQRIEVNVLNFNGDLYGKVLSVELLSRIRDEKKFSGVEELKLQLGKDREVSLHYADSNEAYVK